MTNFGNGNGFPESAISLLWNFLIIEGLGYEIGPSTAISYSMNFGGYSQVLGRYSAGLFAVFGE